MKRSSAHNSVFPQPSIKRQPTAIFAILPLFVSPAAATMPLLPVRIYLRFPMHERLATNPLPRYISILGDLPPIRPIPLWPILHKVFIARRLPVREIRQDNHRCMVWSPPLPSHDFPAS